MRQTILLISIIIFLTITAGGVAESKSIKFDGNAYITATSINENDTLTGTFMMTYYADTTDYKEYYIGHQATRNRLYCRRESNGAYYIGIAHQYNVPAGATDNTTGVKSISLIYDAENYYFIKDGTVYKTGTHSEGINLSASAFSIGVHLSDPRYLKGKVLDVRYYNNCFDTTDAKYITAINLKNTTLHSDSLILWWAPDSISLNKDTIYDRSGNGNHGYLNNSYYYPGGFRNQGQVK